MTAIRVVRSLRELDQDAWARLIKVSEAPVFYGWDFLTAVEAQPLTEGAEPYYVVADDGPDELVAALPVYFLQTRDPFGPGPDAPVVRALISHVWHCYDTTMPSRNGLDPWLLERMWSTVRGLAEQVRADTYGLVNVARSNPLCAALESIGLTAETTVPRYQLDLSGPLRGVDDHLSGVGRASRKTLRAYVRRALRAGASITEEEGVRQLDDQVLELCLATADKHAPGYYPPRSLAALVTALGENCRIVRVDLDGRLLAASICMLDGTRMHAWAGGCLYPADLNWSPQYLLFWAELAAGFQSGRATLECGRRNDTFKARYGLTPVELTRVIEHRGGVK